MRVIKKMVSYTLEVIAYPFLFIGIVLSITGSVALIGSSETNKRLGDLNEALSKLRAKYNS